MAYAAGYGLFLAAAVASMHGDLVRHMLALGGDGRGGFGLDSRGRAGWPRPGRRPARRPVGQDLSRPAAPRRLLQHPGYATWLRPSGGPVMTTPKFPAAPASGVGAG